MTAPPTIVGHLRAACGPTGGGPTDRELIARFAVSRDEGAFELLVWRHAGMVLRTCRGVLRDHQAAEDAAQATFLALARQAGAVGRRGSVAGWLYRVARRIAARAAARKSRVTIAQAGELDQIPGPMAEPESELAGRLLDELDRLSDKYRAPVLLCFFDGLSHADAAKRLGWPVGTVAGRLARAKDRLRRRLSGFTGAEAVVVGVVAVPAFVSATTRAAMAFVAKDLRGLSPAVLQMATREVQSMIATKIQWAVAALAVSGVLTLGGVWAAGQVPGGAPPAKAPPGGGGPPPKAADPDLAKQLAENRKLLEEFDQLTRDFIALQALMNQTTTDPKRAKADGERLKKMADEWLRPVNQKARAELGIAPGRPIPKAATADPGDAGEAKKFDGEWKVVSLQADGRAAPADDIKGMRWSIKGGEISGIDPDGSTGKFLFRLDATKTPKEIDLIVVGPPKDGKTAIGIYRFEKDRLEICLADPAAADQKRPTDFVAAGAGVSKIVLERISEFGTPKPKDSPKKDGPGLIGKWASVKVVNGGTERDVPAGSLKFDFAPDGSVTVRMGSDKPQSPTYTVDPKKDPPEIDLTPAAGVKRQLSPGIYKVEGDTLTLCFDETEGAARPKSFESPAGSTILVITLKREKGD